VFIQKGVEIRPNQLASLLLLISTLMLMFAKDSDRWRWYLLLSGATTALAVLTTQIVLLALPGLATTFFVVFAQRRMSARSLMEGCGIFAGAAAISAIPLLLYFWFHGALNDFIMDNFLLVDKWQHDKWQHFAILRSLLSTICREDGLFVFVVGVGLIECLKQERKLANWWLAVLAPFFSMVLFMPVFPVVLLQYIFLMLPYVAILGGVGAAFAIRTIVVPKLEILQSAMMMLPLAIALHGISLVGHEWNQPNNETLKALRYVVEQTTPNATVMPAWTPGIAFRRPAFFYFSLHS
jgi:4-amino-4-deoxy-L-arabinose transferase-like glycosyltransferase